ncbi:hypothetical protein ACLHDG_11460 [Sulfurovum sp. CS9]|uniref:hypothetical protein n=1 Tax=Sulfurovum sp. CS9 TaxID=3391146 RepID=UPI0039EC608F
MLSLKNIFLNLLLGIMMLSLTAYGDSKNSVPEKSTIKTPNTQKTDKIAGYYETEDFLGYIKEIAEDSL